mmetsp:Transcript_1637/g.1985  ORF Transcript_1637/g.1985 Transcript_1637/m.1985 type:complete len:245 (-) Transcript_1637:1028-1762(-)
MFIPPFLQSLQFHSGHGGNNQVAKKCVTVRGIIMVIVIMVTAGVNLLVRSLRWQASDANSPATLQRCDVRSCINRTRCETTHPLIYPMQPNDVSNEELNIPSQLITDNPDKACVFLSTIMWQSYHTQHRDFTQLVDHKLQWLNRHPLWNGGSNHVLFVSEDQSYEKSLLGGRLTVARVSLLGKSMLWSGQLFPSTIRPMFDVPMALPPHNLEGAQQARDIPANKRSCLRPHQVACSLWLRGSRS